MTPNELRALVGEATQEGLERIPALHKLKKMAPQLALLCAEMGEALMVLSNPDGIVRLGDPSMVRIPLHEFVASALISLEALEKPDDTKKGAIGPTGQEWDAYTGTFVERRKP